jgi:hypothetical protein
MAKRFSGQTARRYDEHMEHSRRALFAKDREIRNLQAALSRAGSTFEYVQSVIRDEGRNDPAWTLARVDEAIGALGLNVNDALIRARRATEARDG